MAVPVFLEQDLADMLASGDVAAERVPKFLRLCNDPEKILRVLECLPADKGQAWHDAIKTRLPSLP